MTQARNEQLAYVGPVRGVFSILVTSLIACLILSIIVNLTGYKLAVAKYLVDGSAFIYIPGPLVRTVGAANVLGIFVGLIVVGVNGLLIGLTTTTLSYTCMNLYYRVTEPVVAAGVAGAGPASIACLIQPKICDLVIRDYRQQSKPTPAVPVSLFLRRTPMKPAFELATSYGKMKLALLEVLEAHHDWSSDPDTHHAGVTLKPHTLKVAERFAREMPADVLAPLLGIAHDLGKILAYERTSTGWAKRSPTHDHLSLLILRSLPEFQGLTVEDRDVMVLVLTFMHEPSKLPVHGKNNPKANQMERIRELITKLRYADGMVTKSERESATDKSQDQDIQDELVRVIDQILPGLNINKHADQKALSDGWTNSVFSYVAIPLDTLNDRVSKLLSEPAQNTLAVRTKVQAGKTHPLTIAIINALREMGYLIETFRSITPDPPLFGFNSERVPTARAYLLKRASIAQRYGDLLPKWGDSVYELRVRSPT